MYKLQLGRIHVFVIVPSREEADAVLTPDDLSELGVVQARKGNKSGTWGKDDPTDIGGGEVGHPGGDGVEELTGPMETECWIPGVWFSPDEAG